MNALRISLVFFVSSLVFLPTLAQSVSSTSNPDSLYFHALRLQRLGDLDQARGILHALLSGHPEYHDARILYGKLLAWNRQYRSALAQIDSVLAAIPSNPEARLTKAQILAWSKRYRQAADILLVLSEENPTAPVYKIELGKVYLWGGSPRRALAQLEKAYLLSPASHEVLRWLARTHRRLRSYELCRYWYEKLLEKVPGDSEAQSEIINLTYRSDMEIQIQGSYESFSLSGLDPHVIGQVEVYASPLEDWKPFLHFSRVSKFSKNDYRYGLGTYVTLNYGLSLLVQGIISPRAAVAPSIDALGELTGSVLDGLALIGGYRYVKFDSTSVQILQPGLTWYVEDDSWFTARGYIGLTSTGPTSHSFTGTLYYRPGALTTLRVGGFFGTEAFRATTLSELSSLKTSGGFAAVKSRIAKPFALELLYQYTARNSPADSHLAIFTVSFLF